MTHRALTVLALLTLLPVLGACGSGREQKIEVADDFRLGNQNASYISNRQRAALVSLFDSGVPIKAVRWPSNSVIRLFANQDLLKGAGAPLPSKFAKRYGADEDLKRSAWTVYQNSVVRGLDQPLIDRYFSSRMGRREIRGAYLMNLAHSCYKTEDKIPAAVKTDAKKIFNEGGAISFGCPGNPSIKPRAIP